MLAETLLVEDEARGIMESPYLRARLAAREQVRYDITWPISGLIRLFFLFKLVEDVKPKRKLVYVYRKSIKGPQAPSVNEGL